MVLILKKIYQGYFFLQEIADRRLDDYVLMRNPSLVLFVILSYLYYCLKLGPKWMENRKAFSLKGPIIVFNLVQVLVNFYLFLEMFICLGKLRTFCAEVDYSSDPLSLRMLRLCYVYFLTKLLDLLDTVFFVLRKKQNQISFLHLYHHFNMVIATWVGLRFWGGGASCVVVMLNSMVHAVMYTYYLLTAFDEQYKKNVWIKIQITRLQLSQFLFFTVYFTGLFLMPTCNYPKLVSFIFVPQNLFMLFLFGDFYYKAYVKKNK